MQKLRNELYRIIFKTDTPAGKAFDVVLLLIISINVLAVMLESVRHIRESMGPVLKTSEWVITTIFTVEYILRIWISKRPLRYILSFYGMVDMLSILPTFLELIFIGSHSLAVIRALRLLRLFRVLKLTRYMDQGNVIVRALWDSRRKIYVFLFGVFTVILIIGTLMYLVEGPEHGFTSIPRGVYWTIVTITTVGFGDITPLTTVGQFIASFTMILGYAVIAVPTGIVSAEMGRMQGMRRVCPGCKHTTTDPEALYCKRCGTKL